MELVSGSRNARSATWGTRMTQMWRWWFVGAGALLPAACTELAGPRAVQLGFTVGPSDATAGVAIGPVVIVAIEDGSESIVTGATNLVPVTIGTNRTGCP